MHDTDTSCILAWLIEEGYEVYAFMADVGQEEVSESCLVFSPPLDHSSLASTGFRSRAQKGSARRRKEILSRGESP